MTKTHMTEYESNRSKRHGWAATSTDRHGERHDIGAGWATKKDAEREIVEQGETLDGVEIYPAVTMDGWETWERTAKALYINPALLPPIDAHQ